MHKCVEPSSDHEHLALDCDLVTWSGGPCGVTWLCWPKSAGHRGQETCLAKGGNNNSTWMAPRRGERTPGYPAPGPPPPARKSLPSQAGASGCRASGTFATTFQSPTGGQGLDGSHPNWAGSYPRTSQRAQAWERTSHRGKSEARTRLSLEDPRGQGSPGVH